MKTLKILSILTAICVILTGTFSVLCFLKVDRFAYFCIEIYESITSDFSQSLESFYIYIPKYFYICFAASFLLNQISLISYVSIKKSSNVETDGELVEATTATPLLTKEDKRKRIKKDIKTAKKAIIETVEKTEPIIDTITPAAKRTMELLEARKRRFNK